MYCVDQPRNQQGVRQSPSLYSSVNYLNNSQSHPHLHSHSLSSSSTPTNANNTGNTSNENTVSFPKYNLNSFSHQKQKPQPPPRSLSFSTCSSAIQQRVKSCNIPPFQPLHHRVGTSSSSSRFATRSSSYLQLRVNHQDPGISFRAWAPCQQGAHPQEEAMETYLFSCLWISYKR